MATCVSGSPEYAAAVRTVMDLVVRASRSRDCFSFRTTTATILNVGCSLAASGASGGGGTGTEPVTTEYVWDPSPCSILKEICVQFNLFHTLAM